MKNRNIPQSNYEMFENNHAICHAMGVINDNTLTNSPEAFLYNYERGHRVFEVDFMTTTDGVMVTGHDWFIYRMQTGMELIDDPLPLEEFKQGVPYEKYTPMTLEELLIIMSQYPDIYIVTDTKNYGYKEAEADFRQIYETVVNVDSSVLDRIIPQIYNRDMYKAIMKSYSWKNVIFTLYQISVKDYYDSLKFALENNIKVITMPKLDEYPEEFLELIKSADVKVFMHTYDVLEDVLAEKENYGIWGVYTDRLTPQEIASIYQ